MEPENCLRNRRANHDASCSEIGCNTTTNHQETHSIGTQRRDPFDSVAQGLPEQTRRAARRNRAAKRALHSRVDGPGEWP